jgi:Flagellar biosynthesis protein, FliO
LAGTQTSGQTLLRVLCRTPVSGKQSIALVQMGGKFAFVGITSDQISLLRVVEDAEEASVVRTELRLDAKKRDKQDKRAFEKVLSRESGEMVVQVESPHTSNRAGGTQLEETKADVKRLLGRLRSNSKRGGLERKERAA